MKRKDTIEWQKTISQYNNRFEPTRRLSRSLLKNKEAETLQLCKPRARASASRLKRTLYWSEDDALQFVRLFPYII